MGSVSSSSSKWEVNTPTHTTAASVLDLDYDAKSVSSHRSSATFTMKSVVTSVPEDGHTYMIREVGSDRVLTLVDGKLTLQTNDGTRGGWHWVCAENAEGWIGFRDAVSGSYIGHDNKGGFICQAKKMDAWEYFVLRPREAGGYNLCVKHWGKLKPVGVARTPPMRLIDAPSPRSAARWEFVKV
ncbi:hypothetical protein GGR51DRAFT_522151 [Nemania sp. FL0031]|nr:hypothetical protein GGR51DRAFT_522151 [Nemania sp. FL0031]